MTKIVEITVPNYGASEFDTKEILDKQQSAIRALLSTAMERIVHDAQQNSTSQEPFVLERPSGEVGDTISASYELPGGKTAINITLLAVRTDEQIVAADNVRRKQRDLEIEMDELLGTQNQHPELPDLFQILGVITIRPKKRGWPQRLLLTGNSARDNETISDESWTLFRRIHEGQVLYSLTTDSTIIGPQHPHETNTWPVPTNKIEMVVSGLREAKFIKSNLTSRNEHPTDLLTRGTFY